MRYILINIILLFSFFISFSQSPESVELCIVTVLNDSLVELKWYYEDISEIDGFIIKRVIYDGNGVVDGTLNNVEIIEDVTSTSYIDTATEYSTVANPYLRSEQYAINAFVYRNDSIIFSNMTPRQNTLFLSCEWSMCKREANFSWNQYENRNVEKYTILYKKGNSEFQFLSDISANQTTFLTSELDTLSNYTFKLLAIISEENHCNVDTSASNLVDIYTFVPKTPDNLQIYNASVINNSYIQLNTNTTFYDGMKKINIYRDNLLIDSILANNLRLFYNDYSDFTVKYDYFIEHIDSCNKVLKKSNIVNNILLKAEMNEREFNLNWSGTTIYNQEADYYEIFADYGQGMQSIKEMNNSTFETNITLYDIFDNNIPEETESIKFQVVAYPQVGLSDSLKSYSNIVDVELDAIFAIPNAINPNSRIEENRYFTIKALFITNFELKIITENGTLIFETDDINNRWDGRKKGQLLPVGAYIYQIKYTPKNGKSDIVNGVINLVY